LARIVSHYSKLTEITSFRVSSWGESPRWLLVYNRLASEGKCTCGEETEVPFFYRQFELFPGCQNT